MLVEVLENFYVGQLVPNNIDLTNLMLIISTLIAFHKFELNQTYFTYFSPNYDQFDYTIVDHIVLNIDMS